MAEDSRIFLAVGSNLDDRYQNLKNGIHLINEHPHIWVLNKSYVYESPAMYYSDQSDFYNMVIEIDTNLNPLQLLHEIKKIELILGRDTKNKKNMPRTLDIDILAIGGLLIHSKLLEIPHPKIAERKFVLKPWNDIASDFIVPNINKNITELLKITTDSSSTRMVLIVEGKESK